MTANLIAEWRKLTTRTFWWLLAGAAAVAAIGTFSTMSATTEPPWNVVDPLHGHVAWVLATINGGIFAIIVGARTFTEEFRHATIAHTYIADPRRTRSTLAKAGAAAGAGVLVGLVTVTSLVAVASLMAVSSGGRFALRAADLVPAVGLALAMALWAVIGAGLGALVRNQVVVVAGGLLWVLMIENLGAGLLEDAGRMLPGQAVHAMAQTREAVDLLPPGSALALMAAYAAVAVLAGLTRVRGRDIG